MRERLSRYGGKLAQLFISFENFLQYPHGLPQILKPRTSAASNESIQILPTLFKHNHPRYMEVRKQIHHSFRNETRHEPHTPETLAPLYETLYESAQDDDGAVATSTYIELTGDKSELPPVYLIIRENQTVSTIEVSTHFAELEFGFSITKITLPDATQYSFVASPARQ